MAESVSYIYQIIDKFTPALRKINAANTRFQSGMKKTSAVANKVGQKLNSLSTLAGTVAGAIGGKIAMDKFIGFETAMNKLESVTLAGTDQMKSMRDMAKSLGATTQFTAGQAAEGMTYLAMAGLNTEQVLQAIPGALQLAAAGGIELGQAADIATNVLGQMGLEIKDLAHVNDVLALAQSKANFNISELFEAMRPVGTTAANLGINLEELTAYLGAMANAGEKGSIAGTLLRNAFTELAAPSKKQIKYYKALGLNLTEFISRSGKITNFKYLLTKLRELNKAGVLSVGVLQEMYGDRGFRAMQILSGKAGEGVAKLEAELKKAGGTAVTAANVQMKGLPGAMKAMSSAIESVVIAIFESGLDKIIIDIANKVTDLARSLSEANPEMLKIIGIAGAVAVALGPILIIFGMMAPVISLIATGLAAISLPMIAVTAAFIGVGAAIYEVWKNWDYLVQDMKAGISWITEKLTSVINLPGKAGMFVGEKLKSFFGFGGPETVTKNVEINGGIAAQNAAASKSTLNGNIVVSAKPGSKVESAGMQTSAPGNLGFNMMGATP